ncbi:hypothetical protein DOTSEDRAFT_24405 [Dothistroma septosporum NZE10]|uniref:Amino acid transporter transmembrane domain-containing protein n=1 Tax=Dothistroma septosporum (strain NZE10 / CBS 128990) TaxID=675120 RepID=N1PLG8_DOTSN|nr:hypothetical protein DOTSEDRAFT_24405 [Dothistroma septosporum NZE10]
MSTYVEKTPGVTVDGSDDFHKHASFSSSLDSSQPPQEKSSLGCVANADPPSDAATNGFQGSNRAEQAGSLATSEADDLQDAGHSKDKCGWVKATCTMIAETLSLGILSLPQAVSKLGWVIGLILLITLGLVTTGTGYCYYLYKMKYPHVRSIPQALENIFGRPARWISDFIIMVYLVFLMAGHLILFAGFVQSFSTPEDGPCRVAVMAIAYFINVLFTFYRKFARLGYVCIACCLSITIATFVCLGYLAANKTENIAAPGNFPAFAFTPLNLTYGAHGDKLTTLFSACAAFSNILLSYSGSICYFNIIDEMEEPRDFWKCLLITNGATVAMYTIAGIGMYCLAGQTVMSPALGSAGSQGAKIAYCFALPTILLAAVILANVQSKRTEDTIYEWRQLDADEQHHSQSSAFSAANILWYIIVVCWWTIAFIVGNSLPWFGPLLSIIGAICGAWICLGWPAMFILHLWRPEVIDVDGNIRKKTFREIKESGGWWKAYMINTRRKILLPTMIFLILFNIAASAVGLYGAVMEFKEAGLGRKPFSCQYDWQ